MTASDVACIQVNYSVLEWWWDTTMRHSLHKSENAKACLKILWCWPHSLHCGKCFYMGVHRSGDVSDRIEKLRRARAVLARLCYTQVLNDSRFLPEDISSKVQRRTQAREKNASFLQMAKSANSPKLKEN